MTSREVPAYEPRFKAGETDPLVNSNMDKGTIVLLENLYGALFRAQSEATFPDTASATPTKNKYPERLKTWEALRGDLETGISELRTSECEQIGSVLKCFKDKLLEIEAKDADPMIKAYMAVIHRTAENVPDGDIKAPLKIEEGLELGKIQDADESMLPEVFKKVIESLSGETPTRLERYSGALYLSRLIETILPAPELS